MNDSFQEIVEREKRNGSNSAVVPNDGAIASPFGASDGGNGKKATPDLLDNVADDDDEEGDGDDNDSCPPLRELAERACKRIDVGAAVLPKPLFNPDVVDYDGSEELRDAALSVQTHYARVLKREFNAVVVEHHLKWAPLCISEPGPLPGGKPCDRLGRYDFEHADSIVDWALQNDMKVKGHVLVWSVTSPKFVKDLEPAVIREQLKRHIFTVVGHYRGRIDVWDVVNEALAPDGGLAENMFLRKLGPSYIEDAFRWAHEADPKATLIYNDNKVEGIGSKKADAFYELLADLKAKKVPVHACGMQSHFNAAGVGRNRPPTPRMVKEQIRRLGQLGLGVHISEMDVRVSQLPAEVRSKAQRQIYHDILAAALSEPAFDGVWLWGFTDRHTWVTHFYYDDEPLVFDEHYQKKEAYYGLSDAIKSLTPGGTVGGNLGVWLEADVDKMGNRWGHEWMRPDLPEFNEQDSTAFGDARPDWARELHGTPGSIREVGGSGAGDSTDDDENYKRSDTDDDDDVKELDSADDHQQHSGAPVPKADNSKGLPPIS